MDVDNSFACSGCGACCRSVGLRLNFSEPVNEDGSCSHLLADNSCAIYENRPSVCNVDGLYEKYFSKFPVNQFHALNHISCLTLMEKNNIPEDKVKPIKEHLTNSLQKNPFDIEAVSVELINITQENFQ